MAASLFIVALSLIFLTQTNCDDVCTEPAVTTNTYTTKSMSLSTLTVYVAEFTVACKENTAPSNLFAEVEAGVVVPVAVGTEANNYQLSWTQDHKMAAVGTIPVKVFSEEGFTEYRKVQRNGGDVTEVKPLFTITLQHDGAVSESSFVQTEFLAVLLCLGVFWSANNIRSQIVA